MELQGQQKQNYLKGAAVLAAATIFVKLVGAVYKIPIFNILGNAGVGAFQTTYDIYALIMTIAIAGVPVALSRMVSAASAKGDSGLVKRYFSVALPAFILIGLTAMSLMFFFADSLAGLMNNSLAAPGIRVLAPAVFFVCIIAVYRGYTQGFQNMIPTAMSQVVEVISKMAFGLIVALWLARREYGTDIVSAGAIMGVTIGLGLCIPLLIWYKQRLDRRLGVQPPPSADGTPFVREGGLQPSQDGDLDEVPQEKLPGRWQVFASLMKVSIPIALGAAFMHIMVVIDSSVVRGRLQSALGLTEYEASSQFGIYTLGMSIFNLPSALVIPIAISIIPAISSAIARSRGDEANSIMQSSVKLVNLLALPAAAGLMVLASPIMFSLYNDTAQVTSTVLTILGSASFFVCFQLISTAILQANGFERLAMLSFLAGGVLRIVVNYFLVAIPQVGIIGQAIGTFLCFLVISIMNITFIIVKVKDRPNFRAVFAKPLLCAALMAVAVYGSYTLISFIGSGFIGTGRTAVTLYLALSIFFSALVYIVLIIVTRTVTREDLKLVPKGEKLAKLLKIK